MASIEDLKKSKTNYKGDIITESDYVLRDKKTENTRNSVNMATNDKYKDEIAKVKASMRGEDATARADLKAELMAEILAEIAKGSKGAK